MRKVGCAAVMVSAMGIVTSAEAVNEGVASLTEKRGLSPIVPVTRYLAVVPRMVSNLFRMSG